MWVCGICQEHTSLTLKSSMRHINQDHFKPEEGLLISCGIDGCEATYSIYDSWYRHIVKHHSEHYYHIKKISTRVVVGTRERETHELSEEEQPEEEEERDEDEILSDEQDTRDIEDVNENELEEGAAEEERETHLEELAAEVEEGGDTCTHEGRIKVMNEKAAIYILGLKAKHSLTQVML